MKIFKLIKLLLYKYNIYKLNTIYDKIKYIKLLELQPHAQYNNFIIIPSLHNNLYDYVLVLSNILSKDMTKDRLVIKDIVRNDIRNVALSRWFTNKGSITTDSRDKLITWLDLVYDLNYKYDYNIKNNYNVIMQNNSKKLQPYIINVETIIESIVDNYIRR